MLSIDIDQAQAYVAPLGQTKFDKSIGSILMNADLAVSMPDMGDMFRNQVKELAEEVLMSQEQGDERTIFLAGAGKTRHFWRFFLCMCIDMLKNYHESHQYHE